MLWHNWKKRRKKKAAFEEKERKKTEREEKKRQREKEQKRKAEERQRKAETKANKAKEAAERKKDKERTAGKRKVSNATVVSMPSQKELVSSPVWKVVIDINTCCVCSVLYSDDRTGKDWIKCACGRWLHEDCAEDCILDSNGKERFCPMCL